MKKYIKYIVLAVLVVVGVCWWYPKGNSVRDTYVTTKIEKGDIVERITASGIINPISTVNIGTQVSGTINHIYVDYNTPVKQGQLLAQIDPALFEATVAQRSAALSVAKAQVDVVRNNITFNKKHLDRIKKLNSSKYTADKELESAERDYKNSLVDLELKQAQVKQAEAELLTAKTNFNYTRIISPVDGIVISREIEVGQTVAASFQTPTLFMVAEDLTKMEISASIVEADIAKVAEGQVVEFTVDSFQDEIFYGMVTQVRNDPVTIQNVVTYDVIIEINNSDQRLKPGMTANVSIITAEKSGVLVVPNQALRFFVQDASGNTKRYKDKGLWVIEGNKLVRISIRTGVYDDEKTEVISDKLKEGLKVVLEKRSGTVKRSGQGGMRMRI